MMAPDLHILACRTYLPQRRVRVADLAAAMPGESERLKATGYRSVAVEPVLYPGDMGVRAARATLKAASIDGSEPTLISFTSIHRHGHKRFWSPASYVQSVLGNTRALPYVINQGCNGHLIAVQMAMAYLAGGPADGLALAIAADRFASSAFDRCRSDYGILYGDAAVAVALGRRPGLARVLDVATVSDPGLEAMHRASEPSPEEPESLKREHDIREGKREFLQRLGRAVLAQRTMAALRSLKERVLPDPAAEDRVRFVVFPNLGYELLHQNYFPVFDRAEAKSLWAFGSTVGHLGAGDGFAGLARLLETGALQPGDRVLLVGAGAGFTWTLMLLEMN